MIALIGLLEFQIPSAPAQSTAPTTLQGGVQQTQSQGDVISGADNGSDSPGDVISGGDGTASGPTTTNQFGTGDPACRQRDAECGGTSRVCYNDAYHSTGIVMSEQESAKLYQETRGAIWIRCGVCRSNVICWPNPGYQDLIAGRASGGNNDNGPGTPQGGGGPNMNDTMQTVVASCGMVKRQQGSFASRPSCTSGAVIDWCERFQHDNPTCIAIIADGEGTSPGPRGASTTPYLPMPSPVVGQNAGPSAGSNDSKPWAPWELGISDVLKANFDRRLAAFNKKYGNAAKSSPVGYTVKYKIQKVMRIPPAGDLPQPYYEVVLTSTQPVNPSDISVGDYSSGPASAQMQQDFKKLAEGTVSDLQLRQDVLAFPPGLNEDPPSKWATLTNGNMAYRLQR
jgi:hypothetical protein